VASPDKTPHQDVPQILDQWAVVDRWWTDEPEHRVYVALRVEDQQIVLRYDRETKEFSFERREVG